MSNLLSFYWNIYINGNKLELNKKKCIESLEFEELCDGSDACTLTINDPDFLFIEDDIFVEEAKVSVNMGWHGDTHTDHFDGYISAIDIDFPDNGFPVLSIFCLDKTHIMNREEKERSWDNVTRPEVVQKIAMEYGFKCVIESGYEFETEDTISQTGVTDIEFCENLAGEEREPFMCKLVDDTIYYVKKGILGTPSAKLYYGSYPYDIVSFKPQINKETKKEEVTKSDINTNDKTEDSATSNDSNTNRDNQGDPVNTSTKVRVYDPKTGEWREEVR